MARLVGGRYELLVRVGGGGQGEVWRARDRQHDRDVAIKIRPVKGKTGRENVLSEARVLLGLRPHQALPLVREDFFEGGSHYLVMDWVEGASLAQRLEREGTPGLALDDVVSHLRQVAEALDHMHAHNPPIVHQDVKPANVIVGADGDVVLVDFGISTTTREPSEHGAGTPSFRAPEIVAGAVPGTAADVYGLAATAFTLLVGTPPRPGPRPALSGVLVAHVTRLWSALDAGLAFDPERRPATAGSFVDALEPAVAPTNLPRSLTPFVGREQDLTAVTKLLASSRLVTLIGTGGLGKTRLAIEAASRMATAYADGVWMAELASLRRGGSIAATVAAIFGVRPERGQSLIDGLRVELRDRNALLVLDNCEHQVDGCASLVAELTGACPGIDVLATSRQAIGAAGEAVYEVQPLTTPDAEDRNLKSLALADAVRLFLDRATFVRPAFRMTAETGPLIADICRRLDGMPLAIVLAAARVGRLAIDEIAERLQESLVLLRTDRRTTPRHQTLLAAFDWSYSFLAPEERRVFTRLAIFPGGFTIESAEAVAVGDGLAAEAVPGVLAELTAKSLMAERADDGEDVRYVMLETVRTYALSKLAENDQELDAREHGLRWALDLATRCEVQLDGPDKLPALARIEVEQQNLREALAFALEHRRDESLPLVSSLASFWVIRGPWGEGRRQLAAALNAVAGPSDVRAKVITGAGRLAFLEADYDVARRLHGEALSAYREAGDRRGEAMSLASLGQIAEARGDYDLARELYGQSLAAYRDLADGLGVADQLTNLGNVAEYSGDYESAQTLHEQGLAQRRALGDDQGAAQSLLNLGYVMNYRGDARGKEFLEESLGLFRRVGDRYGASRALNLLAIRSWFEGDGEQARALGEEALRIRRDINDRLGIAVSLESLGGLAAFQGHGAYAAQCFGAAETLREVIGSPVTPSDGALLQWASTDAKRAIGEETYAAATIRGRSMRLEDAITFALTPPTTLAEA